MLGGRTWYGEPLKGDSNSDGLGDGEEWNRDNDADGTPDLWDADNDNDDVPDASDLSPYSGRSATFSAATPLNLVLNSLQAGEPTYVEFQLRPTNTQHLWYAMNVLDWPQGDRQGQIQDSDGATLYDVCAAAALAAGRDPLSECSANPDANGDMKMFPMLEIRMTGAVTNLPSEQDLQMYGVYTRTLSTSGPVTAVYVPLQLITDPHGDGRVAFYAEDALPAGEHLGQRGSRSG